MGDYQSERDRKPQMYLFKYFFHNLFITTIFEKSLQSFPLGRLSSKRTIFYLTGICYFEGYFILPTCSDSVSLYRQTFHSLTRFGINFIESRVFTSSHNVTAI